MIDMIAKLQDVVVALKTDSAIFGALGDRIFIWQPKTEQTANYLTINIITQIQNIEVNNRTRVEFRYIGWNENTAITTLSLIDKNVTNFLYDNIPWLEMFKFEIGGLANGYDEKKRPIIIRDYIFYYIT